MEHLQVWWGNETLTSHGAISLYNASAHAAYSSQLYVALMFLSSQAGTNLRPAVLRGEAYATSLLGERLSIWEAQARRKSDAQQAKEASVMSLQARQRIQQEAGSGKKALALETRRLEKQRHLDQQRAEIHLEPVQTALHILAQKPTIGSVSASAPMGLLPKAEPSDEAETAPVVHLQIRKRRSHDD